MADEDDSSSSPRLEKPGPSPQSAQKTPSMRRSGFGDNSSNSPLSRNLQTAEEFISSVAAKIAAQPLQYSDPEVWGVLTAISEKARKRRSHFLLGMNMLLTSNEHCIGRVVDDARFQIIAPAVSASHCKMYRKKIATGVTEQQLANCSAFLKDSSTNGTYLNWEKLNKNSFEAKLRHGDIVSVALAPHHELSFAFVYREVQKSSCVTDWGSLKRKPEEYCAEYKRLKGIGIGASDGPLSLDDFRSLQRSNMELRKQLEDQVATIESLHSESRAATEKHETEMKELNESVSKSFQDQFSQLNQFLESKDKELAELSRISAEQKHGIEDLNERLSASLQSCTEANEIIASQKASISELKVLLDEEREQRRQEREKALAYMKMAIQRIQVEAKNYRRLMRKHGQRFLCCETQLRAFYSTTEEISGLLVKQQEQLKAMQRTLEDEENNETTSNDIDLNRVNGNETRSIVRDKDKDKEEVHQSNNEVKTGSGASPHVLCMDQTVSSSDEASVTEKHDCNSKGQEQGEETQEVEFTGAECDDANGEFGSDINAIGTAPLSCGDAIGTEQIPDTEGVGTPQLLEGGTIETEKVLETESLELQSGKNIDLNRCSTPDGDTMQVDNSTNEQETPEHAQKKSQSPSRHDCEDTMEDTEGVGTVNTSDLLASEVAGSWAHSTAPSVPGENDSLDGNECAAPAHDSSSVIAESQHLLSTKSEAAASRRDHERRALSEMIGIVAPDLREQFSRAVESDDRVGSERGVASNSDTEDCSDNEDDEGKEAAREASKQLLATETLKWREMMTPKRTLLDSNIECTTRQFNYLVY
ncbi:myosin heavy chain, non-muscle-like [Salvia splendens]|uniref:myosin heavy chain, non-muscle-like n=1 Tax=Salvia splendens TaxID=180675 RepID=UPI001C263430|nr:myosin heavy chain, non-muscle-like [Salvia splendens]